MRKKGRLLFLAVVIVLVIPSVLGAVIKFSLDAFESDESDLKNTYLLVDVSDRDIAEYSNVCNGAVSGEAILPCEIGKTIGFGLSDNDVYRCRLVLAHDLVELHDAKVAREKGVGQYDLFLPLLGSDQRVAWSNYLKKNIEKVRTNLSPLEVAVLNKDSESLQYGGGGWGAECKNIYRTVEKKLRLEIGFDEFGSFGDKYINADSRLMSDKEFD